MHDFHSKFIKNDEIGISGKSIHILVGITGGIAAYKAAYLVRALKKQGASVKVVMTDAATRFVTPLTYQALSGEPVYTDLWGQNAEHAMDHIALARWADVLIVVPASADILAKMAQGIADSLLTTLYLVTQAKVILCPAMNHSMWVHPATQANLSLLASRNALIIPPEAGEAACGESGDGRLCEIEHVLQYLRLYPLHGLLKGKKCIITAGPTKERLDPVRYLSNDSSGKMGYAIAYAAWVAGAHVTLISGPTALPPPPHIEIMHVESADAMQKAVHQALSKNCIFISAAAVADFTFETNHPEKIKKANLPKTLICTPNPDILREVVQSQKAGYVVGFAAETQALLKNARQKLIDKKLDLIVANDVSDGKAFHQEAQSVTLLSKDESITLPYMHETDIARHIIEWIAKAITVKTALKTYAKTT